METTIRRVLPIRQDITVWFCFTGVETEIHKIKDDSKIMREKNIDRRGHVWHLSDPPSFSLPTTFKQQMTMGIYFLGTYNHYLPFFQYFFTKIFLYIQFVHIWPKYIILF